MKHKVHTSDTINKLNNDKVWYQNIEGVRKPNMFFCYTNEELIEYAKCYNDPIYFFETYCSILNPTSGMQKIKLRDYQKNLIKSYYENRFNLNLCSRQVGMTTMISLLILHELTFSSCISIALMSCKLANSMGKMEKIKSMYINLPFFLKNGITSWNRTSISLESGSLLQVLTKPTIGRSYDRYYLDDFQSFENQDDVMRNLYMLCSMDAKTKINICASSPRTEFFSKMVKDAERKEGDPSKNVYKLNKVYWWEVSGRDETWKNKEIENMGIDLFDKEYDLIF